MAGLTDAIIIKRKKVVAGGGHHGGAWKVAYADFVTAMMAFFLLMWLLNATTEEQRQGIADYFSPSLPLSDSSAGGASIFNGDSAFQVKDFASDAQGGVEEQVREDEDDVGRETGGPVQADWINAAELAQKQEITEAATRPPETADDAAPIETDEIGADAETGENSAEIDRADETLGDGQLEERADLASDGAADDAAATEDAQATDALADAAGTEAGGLGAGAGGAESEGARALQAIEEAFSEAKAEDPDDEVFQHLSARLTPAGLVIEIADVEGEPLFGAGSARPSEKLRLLMEVVAPVIGSIQNAVEIVGHTDARPFGPNSRRTNWDLSVERANEARRILIGLGVDDARVSRIAGAADRAPIADDPFAPQNRRIAITLLRPDPPAAPAAADQP